MRRAMVCHLGIGPLKQATSGRDDLVRHNAEQSRIWSAGVRERSATRSISQNDVLGAVRTISCRIGWTKDRNNRDSESSSEVKGPSISADEKPHTTGERDKFAN